MIEKRQVVSWRAQMANLQEELSKEKELHVTGLPPHINTGIMRGICAKDTISIVKTVMFLSFESTLWVYYYLSRDSLRYIYIVNNNKRHSNHYCKIFCACLLPLELITIL